MKKFILPLLIITIASQAQYHPMLNNSSWIVKVTDIIYPAYYVTIQEGTDVVIGDFTYKKIFDTVWNHDVYLREDVAAKKVYKRVDGVDIVEFDFGMEISDTILLENGITYTLTAIIPITIADGTTRNVFSLNSIFGPTSWIEGIGTFENPLQSCRIYEDPVLQLMCVFQNGVNIFHSGTTDCASLNLSDSSEMISNSGFTPNPFVNETTLKLNYSVENATLKVVNLLGQTVNEIKNIHGNEITVNRENLKNGIYIFQLFENDKLVTIDKLIIID